MIIKQLKEPSNTYDVFDDSLRRICQVEFQPLGAEFRCCSEDMTIVQMTDIVKIIMYLREMDFEEDETPHPKN